LRKNSLANYLVLVGISVGVALALAGRAVPNTVKVGASLVLATSLDDVALK
jgi:hypothetical protein